MGAKARPANILRVYRARESIGCREAFGFLLIGLSWKTAILAQLITMVTTVNLQVPIESLIAAIDTLELEDWQKLLEILEQKIFEAEEANYEEDSETTAEIKAIQAEYDAGDYVTFDDYLASHSGQAS